MKICVINTTRNTIFLFELKTETRTKTALLLMWVCQSAKTESYNIESNEKLTTRLLLDTGNQRKTLSSKNHCQPKIKHCHQNELVFIEALCVPVTSTLIKMQETPSAQGNYGHLSKLKLVDFDDVSIDLPVGLVIGVDYYFCFFTNKVIKVMWTSCLRN